MGADKNERFLERWSRRKNAARTEADAPAEALETAPLEPGRDETPELTDAELLEKLELPDPDRMAAGDDFSAFMRDGVPARLRNRALRRLWLTNPTLANLDELVDYGEDFTDAATVIEGMQTIYQVGRGLVAPETESAGADESAERALDDGAAAEAPEPAVLTESSDPGDDRTPPVETPVGLEAPAESAAHEAVAGPARASVPPEPTQRRRRMAFRFE